MNTDRLEDGVSEFRQKVDEIFGTWNWAKIIGPNHSAITDDIKDQLMYDLDVLMAKYYMSGFYAAHSGFTISGGVCDLNMSYEVWTDLKYQHHVCSDLGIDLCNEIEEYYVNN